MPTHTYIVPYPTLTHGTRSPHKSKQQKASNKQMHREQNMHRPHFRFFVFCFLGVAGCHGERVQPLWNHAPPATPRATTAKQTMVHVQRIINPRCKSSLKVGEEEEDMGVQACTHKGKSHSGPHMLTICALTGSKTVVKGSMDYSTEHHWPSRCFLALRLTHRTNKRNNTE